MESFRVVFWGEAAAGYSKGEVARAFAKKFKIKSRSQLTQIFSGRVIPLKKNLTITEAHRYISAIQDLGGICRLESEQQDYFETTELKERHEVSFLNNDFDPNKLSLEPKKD